MKSYRHLGLSLAAVLSLVVFGCTRDTDSLGPASFPKEGVVFEGGFAPGIEFQAFGNSKVDALDIDRIERFRNLPTLRFTVPAADDPSGGYAGGAFVGRPARDLSDYDAVTFWARTSTAATLNLVGMGNDNTGNSRYPAVSHPISVSTTWTKYIFPLPLASKLIQEAGLFQLADNADGTRGYDLWLADIQYEKTGAIVNPRPFIETRTVSAEVGEKIPVQGTTIIFDVDGEDLVVDASGAYLTYASSDESVATVSEEGEIEVVGTGEAVITAELGDVPASGSITVTSAQGPAGPAPTPDYDAEKVISLFSDEYTNEPVDTWSAEWDAADVEDVQIDGSNTKKYTNLVFAGIEFTSQPIDATEMTYLRTDVWVQDATSFTIKLVDAGPNGIIEGPGSDDSESEILFTPSTTPGMVAGDWSVLEVPLARFAGLAGRSNLAQMIITSSSSTVYLDNVLFYDGGEPPPPPAPEEAAPTPTEDAANVISLFSNAYENVTVDTWSAEWDAADVEDIQIQGVDTKKYSNVVFAGIEFTSEPIDAAAMTHFHMNVWTPEETAVPKQFKIKLVDAGANGIVEGPGSDDSEHEIALTAETTPALGTGTWLKLEIPLSEFTGLTGRTNLAQMILSGDLPTFFVDNVYFRKEGPAPTEPSAPAPEPTEDAANVISLFSNVYDDEPVDTWSAGWDSADLEDIQIQGVDTKKYTNLVFAGIEFTSQPIDATEMTHFHMNMWTPDETAVPAQFRIKLVDAGANGIVEGPGSDDSEHEVTLTAETVPALGTGTWLKLEIPLSEFTGLTGRTNLAQMIISGDPNTVFVDNVYFRKEGPAPTEPSAPAPEPTEDAANVISLFSSAYTNVTVDTWSAGWDSADLEDIEIQGIPTKKYSNLVFAGIEFTSQPIDATEMTYFHMNAWTPDETAVPAQFRIKLVDAGANGIVEGPGSDDSEHEVTLTAETVPALGTGTWLKLEIPLSEFTGLTGRTNLAQLILSGDLPTVFVDNVYFYAASSGGSGVIDFEPGGIGATWTWNVFENVDNPPLEVVANPDAAGANTSATVAKFTARQAGQPWAGTQTLDKETFTLDASNAIVKIMVYKSVISDVGIKFEQGAASTGEIKVANTVINQWEELTFDFSGVIGPINTDITGLVVFPDFNAERTSDNVVYFDNISFGPVGGGGGTEER